QSTEDYVFGGSKQHGDITTDKGRQFAPNSMSSQCCTRDCHSNLRTGSARFGVRRMCGIVGIFSRGEAIPEGRLQRATRSLLHRGADGQGYWTSPDRHVGLGHARLSIIDLATGSQPIASEDGRSQIAVNGEFYGYEALQRQLEQSGHRLRTRSDSEIALH